MNSKISGFQLRYSELSALHPPGTNKPQKMFPVPKVRPFLIFNIYIRGSKICQLWASCVIQYLSLPAWPPLVATKSKRT